jgi:hypothetical protein
MADGQSLPSWNDSAAKSVILDFVARVTEQGGTEFVPPAGRIATFDNDGTLWCEQPLQIQFFDTTSDFAEIIFAILGVAAKLERRRILERTARGRANAKKKGVKFGRKPTLTPHQQKEARKRLEAGETQRSVARSYNVSQSTISRLPA